MTKTQTQTHREGGDVRHLGPLLPLKNVDYSMLFLLGLNYLNRYLDKCCSTSNIIRKCACQNQTFHALSAFKCKMHSLLFIFNKPSL